MPKSKYDLDSIELDPNPPLTPFSEGELHAFHGGSVSDCPYQYGTVECQDWVDGFNDLLTRG